MAGTPGYRRVRRARSWMAGTPTGQVPGDLGDLGRGTDASLGSSQRSPDFRQTAMLGSVAVEPAGVIPGRLQRRLPGASAPCPADTLSDEVDQGERAHCRRSDRPQDRRRRCSACAQRLAGATCQPLQRSRSPAENSSPRARPPDYDDSSARRDHQASATVIALSASRMPPPTSPAVAAQCRGTSARAPGSQRCSSRVSGSGAVPS